MLDKYTKKNGYEHDAEVIYDNDTTGETGYWTGTQSDGTYSGNASITVNPLPLAEFAFYPQPTDLDNPHINFTNAFIEFWSPRSTTTSPHAHSPPASSGRGQYAATNVSSG